jgi:4-amino-4-deoxy-L-arabinose transferase-like glycosyltransferase
VLLFALVAVTIAVAVYVRLRYASAPLERDEGEYAYAGQLILQGIPPYELAYNMKFPGTYYAYAAIMAILGETPWAIRVGLLAVHFASAGVLFVLTRRLAGTLAAAIAAVMFIWLGLDRWSMGVFGHATHFVILPALVGLLFLHRALVSGGASLFIAAGIGLGTAVVMKQQALFFAAFGIVAALWSARQATARTRPALVRAASVAAGLAVPFAVLVTTLAIEGVLGRFWFWTFQYAASYVSQTPWSAAADMLGLAWSYITRGNWPLWYVGLAGLALLWLSRWSGGMRAFTIAWLVASFLAITPGFYFRPHYFLLLMPIAGVLAGIAVTAIDRTLARRMSPIAARIIAIAVAAAAIALYVVNERAYLFRQASADLMASVYESNPFPEAQEIGRYLEAHTSPADRIIVLGSEPEIYFYANRKSATGYIYTYALMERQPFAARMQEEMIREIEAAQPAYLVFVGVAASWGAQPGAGGRVFTWANEFTGRCYDRVGVADIDRARGTTLRWDDASRGYEPRSQFVVLTFKRRC